MGLIKSYNKKYYKWQDWSDYTGTSPFSVIKPYDFTTKIEVKLFDGRTKITTHDCEEQIMESVDDFGDGYKEEYTEHSLIDENGECVYQDDIIKWRLVK